MERHDADAQRPGDLALRLAGGGEHPSLLELGGNFSARMSLGFHGRGSPDIGAGLFWVPAPQSGNFNTLIVNNKEALKAPTESGLPRMLI